MKTVFITGWAFSGEFIQSQMEKANVITHDQIFFINASDLLSDYSNIKNINNYYQDLAIKIDKKISSNNEIINIVGWSLGGLISLVYSNLRPNKVKQLKLINGTSNFIANNEERLNSLNILKNGILKSKNEFLSKFYYGLLKENCHWGVNLKPTIKTLLDQSEIFNETDLINALNFLSETNYTKNLNSITCPVQIICGKNDLLTSISHGIEISNNIKDSFIQEITNHGHLLPISNPKLII